MSVPKRNKRHSYLKGAYENIQKEMLHERRVYRHLSGACISYNATEKAWNLSDPYETVVFTMKSKDIERPNGEPDGTDIDILPPDGTWYSPDKSSTCHVKAASRQNKVRNFNIEGVLFF